MSLTKQGVRNLNPPKQKNERRAPQSAACFHDWRHQRDCIGCADWHAFDSAVRCEFRCDKCGEQRRDYLTPQR